MRGTIQDGNGFTYSTSELSSHIIVGKDACPDSIAVADLDGDGWPDLVALESPGYDMVVREVVALHGPSGRVAWRALKGHAGTKLTLTDGVVVVAVSDDTALSGLDARNGQPLWTQPLPAPLSDSPYENTWNAPALTDLGRWVAFETEDGSAHVIEARTGRIVVSRPGRLAEHGHDVPGVVLFFSAGYSDRELSLWDLARGREIHKGKTQGFAPLCAGPEGTFVLFHAEALPPNDIPMTRAITFDLATCERRATCWVTPSEDWNVLPHFGAPHDRHRSALLPGGRLLLGSNDDEKGGIYVLDLAAAPPPAPPKKKGFFSQLMGDDGPPPKPASLRPTTRLPPPAPEHTLRAIEVFGPVIVTVWEEEDSKKLVAMGLDAQTLAPRWRIDCGGTNLMNHVHRAPTGLLLPFAPGGKDEFSQRNPIAWWHVDPMSGQKMAEYAVPSLDCTRVCGKYLVGFLSGFTSGYPVIWDLALRQRMLLPTTGRASYPTSRAKATSRRLTSSAASLCTQ